MFDILVDDQRDHMADIICRTGSGAFVIIKQLLGQIDTLYLDHDLGMEPEIEVIMPDEQVAKFESTGYGICCYLERLAQLENGKDYLPKTVQLVSSSPVGLERMRTVLSKLYPYRDEGRYTFTSQESEEWREKLRGGDLQ